MTAEIIDFINEKGFHIFKGYRGSAAFVTDEDGKVFLIFNTGKGDYLKYTLEQARVLLDALSKHLPILEAEAELV